MAQAMLLSAAILGVSMAEVGVSIQHDANHGAFSNSTWVGALLVRSPDLLHSAA
jgi:linoleoyl-CoA desaturase